VDLRVDTDVSEENASIFSLGFKETSGLKSLGVGEMLLTVKIVIKEVGRRLD
jgi:hypothetical protein